MFTCSWILGSRHGCVFQSGYFWGLWCIWSMEWITANLQWNCPRRTKPPWAPSYYQTYKCECFKVVAVVGPSSTLLNKMTWAYHLGPPFDCMDEKELQNGNFSMAFNKEHISTWHRIIKFCGSSVMSNKMFFLVIIVPSQVLLAICKGGQFHLQIDVNDSYCSNLGVLMAILQHFRSFQHYSQAEICCNFIVMAAAATLKILGFAPANVSLQL